MSESDFWQIGPPSASDLRELLQLWRDQYNFHFQLDPSYYRPFSNDVERVIVESVREQLATNEPGLLVARLRRKLCGFVSFSISRPTYLDAGVALYGEVKELFVTSAARRAGIGIGLMAGAEAHFRARGIHLMVVKCSSFNREALAFYGAIGYERRQELLFRRLPEA